MPPPPTGALSNSPIPLIRGGATRSNYLPGHLVGVARARARYASFGQAYWRAAACTYVLALVSCALMGAARLARAVARGPRPLLLGRGSPAPPPSCLLPTVAPAHGGAGYGTAVVGGALQSGANCPLLSGTPSHFFSADAFRSPSARSFGSGTFSRSLCSLVRVPAPRSLVSGARNAPALISISSFGFRPKTTDTLKCRFGVR
jgi:hypothetical protein